MDLQIAGKRALVVGGSAGLGLAVSRALAAEAADLVLFARNQDRLNQVAADLTSDCDTSVETYAGDLTSRTDTAEVARYLEASGGLDILIVNSPRPPSPMREFLDETEDSRWTDAFHDQLEGVLNILRDVTPLLLNKGWGRIVAITSASVKNPYPKHALSTIFRAGVQAALKHLANEVGEHGVTVNSVAPATIITPTFGQFHDVTSRVNLTALKRPGRQEEIAATVAFLASEGAGYITGETIQVDGGRNSSLT